MANRCRKCGELFAFPCLLARHQARKRPCAERPPEKWPKERPPHRCEFCNKNFSSAGNLVTHVESRCSLARQCRDTPRTPPPAPTPVSWDEILLTIAALPS